MGCLRETDGHIVRITVGRCEAQRNLPRKREKLSYGPHQPNPGSDDRSVQTVLNAFDTLFNKRDYVSAERFWSPHYIQHSAHIPPGRDGLFDLVKSLPVTLRYENHIRRRPAISSFSTGGSAVKGLPAAWVVADIVRMENGLLAEHWDVIQDEATREQSRSGLPMFGDKFPA